MSRLPTPGQDSGTWGDILNDFLQRALKPDGTIKDNAVTSNTIAPNSVTNAAIASNAINAVSIADGSITEALLDTALQAKVNQAALVTSVNAKTGAVVLNKSDISLDQVDNTSDVNKPVSTAAQTALNSKVDKVATPLQIYSVNGSGNQSTLTYGDTATANMVIRRDANARAKVADPSAAQDIATKNYVDTTNATRQAKFMTGTVSTGSGTAAKTVTLDSPWGAYTPAAGDWFFITFANGSSVSAPTLSINGSSAFTIQTPQGSTSAAFHSFTVSAPVLFYYDGTVLFDYGTNAGEISIANITNTTGSTQGTITGRRAEALLVQEAGVARTLTNKTLTSPLVNKLLDINGNTSVQLNATASAVNYLFLVNGAASNSVSMRANGTDTNIPIGFFSKGTGQIQFRSDTNGFILTGDSVASGVNYVGLTNATTGTGPTLMGTGTDTNVDLNITAKGTGKVGIPAGTPFVLYNTADQTTNYERGGIWWDSNILNVGTQIGGTGSNRSMYLSLNSTSYVTIRSAASASGRISMAASASSTAGAIGLNVVTSASASSGTQYGTVVAPAVSQSSTAGYTALVVNPTETTTGTGAKLLADFQVGGTSKTRIDNTGTLSQSSTASLVNYNTADEVTNYERLVTNAISNVFTMASNSGGSGTTRPVRMGTNNTAGGTGVTRYIQVAPTNTAATVSMNTTSGAGAAMLSVETSSTGMTASSGTQYGISLTPTFGQTSTAGYTVLYVNATESSTGSGTRLLADYQLGGSTKWSLRYNGIVRMGDVGGVPGDTPVSSGYLFIDGGALKYKGSSGTVTTIAPA